MRRVEKCPVDWSGVAFRLAVAGLFGVTLAPAAAAVTLGAFEVRLSEMRAPLAESAIEAAFDNTSTQFAFQIAATAPQPETLPNPATAATSAAGASEPSPGSTADGKTPAAAAAPIPAGAPQKPASAARINVPKPGDAAAATYYDGRAKELLQAERGRQRDGFQVEMEPGVTAVICYAGCINDTVGVVYVAQAASDSAAAPKGEMTQTATNAATEDAAQKPAAEITCIAGCYDDSPKVYPIRAVSDDLHKAQDALERAVHPRKPADPENDWLTAKKKPKAEGVAPAAPRKPAKRMGARTTKRIGTWLTSIDRAPDTTSP